MSRYPWELIERNEKAWAAVVKKYPQYEPYKEKVRIWVSFYDLICNSERTLSSVEEVTQAMEEVIPLIKAEEAK